MKNIKLINLVLITSLFGGCALLAPSYKKPKVETPSASRNGDVFESTTHDLSALKWWQQMNDQALNQLINAVLKNNNQIQIAQANILQAQARLKAAQYLWLPSLSATGGGFAGNTWSSSMYPQGQFSKFSKSGAMGNTDFNGYYGGFVPSYNLNIFANINQNKLAKANLEMQKATFNATRLSVISQTSGAYFMLLGQKKQLELQQQFITDLQVLRNLQLAKYQNGASDYSLITLLDQQIADSQSKIPSIENALAQTENAIQVLLNKNPGPIVTKGNIDKLTTTNLIPSNLSSAVLKNRPDILVAEAQLKMANANVGLASSMFFPSINITGLIGGASVALSNLFSIGTGFWAIQAAASMPILNASTFEEIKAAKGGYYVAYYNYMQTVKAAFADVDNSLTNQQKITQTYQQSLKAEQAVQAFYKIANAKYQAGAKDYASVVEAKLDADYTALGTNQIKMQQLDSIVQVYQSLAGGYAAESELSKLRKID